jgi:hypothetical protein
MHVPEIEAYRSLMLDHTHEYQPLSEHDSQYEHCPCGALRERYLREEAEEDRWTSAS